MSWTGHHDPQAHARFAGSGAPATASETPDTAPRQWSRLALPGLLLATGVLYFYGLTANGWANSFYSAAVQAGSES